MMNKPLEKIRDELEQEYSDRFQLYGHAGRFFRSGFDAAIDHLTKMGPEWDLSANIAAGKDYANKHAGQWTGAAKNRIANAYCEGSQKQFEQLKAHTAWLHYNYAHARENEKEAMKRLAERDQRIKELEGLLSEAHSLYKTKEESLEAELEKWRNGCHGREESSSEFATERVRECIEEAEK